MRPRGTPQQLEQRRRQAIRMLEAGRSTREIAVKLHVDPRSVRRWRESHRRRGEAGLASKPAPGRPPKLNSRQREALRKRLLKGGRANGFPTDLWTCPRIADLIQRRYGVTYHVDHLPRLLRQLGFSPQKPAKRAAERDEQAIATWVAKDWPRIKKTPRGGRRTSSSSTKSAS